MEKFITGTGQIVYVHDRKDCEGGYCVCHNPSNHHMISWPTYWRDDLGIMERVDIEGVGHPDPDSLDYIRRTNPKRAEALSIHGCNGLCNPETYKKYVRKEL